jgi:hypothetical protein
MITAEELSWVFKNGESGGQSIFDTLTMVAFQRLDWNVKHFAERHWKIVSARGPAWKPMEGNGL